MSQSAFMQLSEHTANIDLISVGFSVSSDEASHGKC